MQSTLDAALERAQMCAAKQILRLHMKVGALTGVVPDALHFAFEALREGTMASKAELEIHSVPVRYWCDPCGREFEPVDLLPDCPSCGRPSSETRTGLELELTSMEVI